MRFYIRIVWNGRSNINVSLYIYIYMILGGLDYFNFPLNQSIIERITNKKNIIMYELFFLGS